MQLGIIGMSMSGKSTVFDLLSDNSSEKGGNKAAIAMMRVPDARIDYLSSVYKPRKTIYTQLELVDIPGLMPGGDSKGARMFLDQVRKADALLQVVRVFEDSVLGMDVAPMSEIESIAYELLLADLELIEKRIERINASKKKAGFQVELSLLERLKEALENETPMSQIELTDEEKELLQSYEFLTTKPVVICLNLSEDAISSGEYPDKERIAAYCAEKNIQCVELSAMIEKEISELSPEEREEFLKDLGITESGLVKVARGLYSSLGLISFFTVGKDEVRAWTIHRGDNARRAAGKIHTDIEKGFIRAEVVAYKDFVENGSMQAVKDKGLFRLEGKEYIIQDGDIAHFRFNI